MIHLATAPSTCERKQYSFLIPGRASTSLLLTTRFTTATQYLKTKTTFFPHSRKGCHPNLPDRLTGHSDTVPENENNTLLSFQEGLPPHLPGRLTGHSGTVPANENNTLTVFQERFPPLF